VRTGHPDARAGRPKKLVVQCFFSFRAVRTGSAHILKMAAATVFHEKAEGRVVSTFKSDQAGSA